MDSTVKNIAAAYLAPKVLRRFRFYWIVIGVAAYYGLKLLSKKGILPKQTNAALGLIDQGVDFAKEKVGLTTTSVAEIPVQKDEIKNSVFVH